ncbi:hypothetical protein CVO74_04465 [Xanthomonas prunicola]|uniref:Uncharacterized protein n=1 Tax=Xanthomonas prunicola TaxID=2053930 RepID=A0A2N3RN30_9XANT|nr:hypothetical protein XpruCFBP8353_01995 [Xanthomonas prunicola]PKV18187.1 hypothetical protein XpruCFBP8354_01995 [Xanthomonas prunicola]PKV22502.1 hypothetical protein CVO74_04465 [Xanthomonas prunicola]
MTGTAQHGFWPWQAHVCATTRVPHGLQSACRAGLFPDARASRYLSAAFVLQLTRRQPTCYGNQTRSHAGHHMQQVSNALAALFCNHRQGISYRRRYCSES